MGAEVNGSLAWEAGAQTQRQQRRHAGPEAVARHHQLPPLREHSAAVIRCHYMCWVVGHCGASVTVQEHTSAVSSSSL